MEIRREKKSDEEVISVPMLSNRRLSFLFSLKGYFPFAVMLTTLDGNHL